MNRFDVVFTIDKNYIQHFAVALTSLLENNPDRCARVFLVHDFEDLLPLTILVEFFDKNYSTTLILVTLDPCCLSEFRITEHVSKATYFRLLLPKILPDDVDNILFLDSDLVVDGDLSALSERHFDEIPEQQYYVYAVDHKYSNEQLLRIRNLGMASDRYFNAGVMLINLKKWRDDDISSRLMTIADEKKSDLLWWDQDVLNLAFDGSWGRLPDEFNHIIGMNACSHPIVIHYAGGSKPWYFMNGHPFKKSYWRYLKLTPFKTFKPHDKTAFNVIAKLLIPEPLRIKLNAVLGR